MKAAPVRILLLVLCLAAAGLVWPASHAGAAGPRLAQDDWMSAADVWNMPVKPADGAICEQTPPDFSWPFRDWTRAYDFELTYPDGTIKNREVVGNWLLYDEKLEPGEYAWRVRPIRRFFFSGSWSEKRGFRIAPEAQPYVVPPLDDLWRKVAELEHPRGFPRGEELVRLASALEGERLDGWWQLKARVRRSLTKSLTAEPGVQAQGIDDVRARRQAEVKVGELAYAETVRLLEAAFVWRVSGDEQYLKEAKRRLLNLAAWDPQGATSFKSVDLVCAEIAWSLAVAFDWLYGELDPAERSLVLDGLRPRLEDMFKAILGRRRPLERFPYDSHGRTILATVACVSVLLVGEEALAETWFRQSLPLYLASFSPFGGEDGGYGNGTSYAVWALSGRVLSWDIIRYATGVNVYDKAWLRNFGRYMVYFLPPGTPRGCFGDGAERKLEYVWSLCAKAYAARLPTPLYLWYAAQWPEKSASRLELLFAPASPGLERPAGLPDHLPQSAWFPSIGWAALHSDLADKERVSVYFKSSSYGSFNHSHAEQNSFVISARGKPLAIDSGYYDWYGSPHWTNWYTLTVAHNAITFDNGQGQSPDDREAAGRISRFSHHEAYDIVVGDATQAYLGQLSRALRSLVFLRPATLIVYDDLASSQPRQWEWNIHALERIAERGPGQIEIKNQGARLGVRFMSLEKTEFHQTDEFTSPPDPAWDSYPKQWHGVFRTTEKSETAEFLAVLGVDKESPLDSPPSINRVGEGWEIRLRNLIVLVGRAGCTVRPAQSGSDLVLERRIPTATETGREGP